MEIERKFLVSSTDFMHEAQRSYPIRQGFICTRPEAAVRIRITEEQAYITIKGASSDDGISRYEWEKEIPVDEARELMKLCTGEIIRKTRYEVPANGGLLWEIDVFEGNNLGLIIAEIELPQPSAKIDLPPWIDREITGQEKYYNLQLSINPYREWEKS